MGARAGRERGYLEDTFDVSDARGKCVVGGPSDSTTQHKSGEAMRAHKVPMDNVRAT